MPKNNCGETQNELLLLSQRNGEIFKPTNFCSTCEANGIICKISDHPTTSSVEQAVEESDEQLNQIEKALSHGNGNFENVTVSEGTGSQTVKTWFVNIASNLTSGWSNSSK